MITCQSRLQKLPHPLWFILGAIGLFLAITLYHEAFPTAHLSFTLKRSEILPLLQKKLISQHAVLDSTHSALAFSSEDNVQHYLELEVGQKKLEELQRAGLHLWAWEARWFKPEQQEEWNAALDPQGRWVEYSHEIEETRAGASLSETEARAIAEKFLEQQITQHPLSKLRFIETQSETKPHRKDYTFTWERDDLRVKEAPYRLYIGIQGDQIGSYSENLKIPETWNRAYARKRELNTFFQNMAQYACLPLFLVILIFVLLDLRKGIFSWKIPGSRFWIYAIIAGILLQSINQSSSQLFSYSTTDPWSSFWLQLGFGAFFNAAGMGFLLTALLLFSAHFYIPPKEGFLDFKNLFRRSALNNTSVVQSLGIGILLSFIHMAYASGFYLLGRHWGVWCPLDLDYNQAVEGPIPWIEGFMTGYSASLTEELIFRVLGVFALLRLTKNRAISIILPAIIWGFLHSNYPQSPGYIRGLELTIVGISYGWIMLRYGIATTLLSHFCYNCWQSLIPVFQLGGFLNILGSLIVGGWPLLFFALGLRGVPEEKEVDPKTSSTNQSNENIFPIPSLFIGTPLTPRLPRFHRLLLAFVGTTLFALSFLHFLPTAPQNAFLKKGSLQLTRETVLQKAAAILKEKQKGIDPQSYRTIVTTHSGSSPSPYLAEHLPLSELASRWFSWNDDIFYSVRFFRLGEKEEFQIELHKNGDLLQWNHLITRETPGASLDLREALTLAENEIQKQTKIDLSLWKRVTEDLIQQENRRDWQFEWENPQDKIGEAVRRISIRIQGVEPLLFDSWYKIPEQWERDQNKTTPLKVILEQIGTVTGILFVIAQFYLFIVVLRKELIPWRWVMLLSLIPLIFSILQELDQIPWFLNQYQTHQPLHLYVGTKIGSWVTSNLKIYITSLFSLGSLLGLLRLYFGFRPKHLLCSIRNDSLETRDTRLAWLIFTLGLFQTVQSLQTVLSGMIDPVHSPVLTLPSVNHTLPGFSLGISELNNSYETIIRDGLFLTLILWLRRRFTWALPLLILFILVSPGFSAKTLPEFLVATLFSQCEKWIFLFFIWKVWKFDWYLIFTLWTMNQLIDGAIDFAHRGGPYSSQSIAVSVGALLLLLPLFWTRPPKIKYLAS